MNYQSFLTAIIILLFVLILGGCENNNIIDEKVCITISPTMPEDDGVIRTVQESDSVLAEDEYYLSGLYPVPDYVFMDNGTAHTFALVWLPDNWYGYLPSNRRVIIHLHGHCALGAMHFSKWHMLARSRNLAVIAPQVWLDDNTPPEGYSVHPDGGYHLDVNDDIYPFTDALLQHYGASSAMIHGFSMFACASVVLTYRDKFQNNLLDFTVFNAGRIGEDHPFRHEIEKLAYGGEHDQFSGEQFFFFIELSNQNPTYQQQLDARSFVETYAGEVVMSYESEGPHGVFFSPVYDNLRSSVVAYYDSMSTLR